MTTNKLTPFERRLDAQGRVTSWPLRRRAVQLEVIAYLASKFDPDRVYREREVNELLRQWHLFDDPALLRRELFELGYLSRRPDGTDYKLRVAD